MNYKEIVVKRVVFFSLAHSLFWLCFYFFRSDLWNIIKEKPFEELFIQYWGCVLVIILFNTCNRNRNRRI